MKVNLISGVSAAKRNNLRFASRVIHERSPKPLPQDVLDFVDKFEDNCSKDSDGARKNAKGFSTSRFEVANEDHGESAHVYFVEPKESSLRNLSSIFTDYRAPSFVIKESKPLEHNPRTEQSHGGLSYEYDMAKKAHDIQSERVQNPLAYVETQNGSKFMLSETIKNIDNFGYSTSQVESNLGGNEINETYIRSALNTLAKFDNEKLFHPDLTRSNVKINTYNKGANFIDFQWSEDVSHGVRSYIKSFTFEPSEYVNNIAPFEANVIADYLIGMMGHDAANNSENKDIDTVGKARQALKEYLQIRADYAPRSSEFDVSVFKNPSDDILDAELLRLALLRNHRLQFLYTDDNIERPRNMMKLVGYSALANQAAKQLENFKPKNPPRNANEAKYFEYMKEYGKFWHANTKEWYTNIARYMYKVVKGDEKAPGKYFENLFKSAGVESNLSHFELLNKESDAYKTWDSEVDDLADKVNDLEKCLDRMNRGREVEFSKFIARAHDLYD